MINDQELGTLQIVIVIVINGPNVSQAAHFSTSGTSNIHYSITKSLSLTSTCNVHTDVSTGTRSTTIDPDPGENVGDPVAITYCYSADASTSVTSPAYSAAAGVGSSSLTASCPFSYSNPDPATVILNPGPNQQTVLTYGPQNLVGNQTLSLVNQCGTVFAHVGDTLKADGGIFVVLDGPEPSSGTGASLAFTVDINLPSQAEVGAPALSGWAEVILALLLGVWPVYHMRGRRVVR